MGTNFVILFGNVGKDPDCKNVGEKGTLIAEFPVATSKPPKNQGDKWPTEWHTIKAFGRTAEKIQKMMRKGDFVALKGEAQTESWGPEGQKKYKHVVMVNWPDDIAIEQRSSDEQF